MSLTSTSRLLRGDSPSCWSPVRAHYHRGLGADTDLVRPSNTALLSIKIQRMGLSPATPPSFTFLTSLWTPRVCTFIGGGGQVDEVFGIIYPVVSLAEAPTCPRLHPHLGSSGPVKHKHRLSWIWEGNERRGDFWWTHRSHHLWACSISTNFRWWLKELLQAVRFKEAPGFSLSLLSAEFTIRMADSKAKWICQSNGGSYALLQAVYRHWGLINRNESVLSAQIL